MLRRNKAMASKALAIWVLGYAGMAWAQTGAPSVEVNLGYDANGREISQTSPLGHTTTLSRDPLGRITTQTHPDNSAGSVTYNALGHITSATDPNGVGTSYTVDALGNVLAVSNSDEGNSSATVDAAGNLLTRTDANGQTTAYTYDALNRLQTLKAGDGTVTTFLYDGGTYGKGQLTKLIEAHSTTWFTYNERGRISRKTQVLKNGSTHKLSYGYDSAGQLSRITYPSGRQVLYTYSLGRITAVSTQASARAAVQLFISAIQYNALGQPLSWTWFNGDSASRSYDTAARPSASEIASITYDEDGRITGIVQHQLSADGTQPHSNSHSIGYDNRDRLTRFAMNPGASSNDTGYSQTYSYDTNNNRTASTDQRTTAQGSLNTLQGWTLQSSSNRLNQRSELSTLDGAIQTSRTDSYTLDAAGNQSDDGWQRFQYDPLNRLSRSIGTSHSVLYLHNALGQRSFKSAPKPESLNTPVRSLSGWIGQWVPWAQGGAIADNPQRQGTAFMYDEAGQLLGEYLHDGSNPNSQSGEYIWLPRPDGGSELVGYVKSQGSNSQRYAVHSDHLGTPRRITNESGQPVWQWAYSAYGDNAAQVLAAAEPGFAFNPRFPGQYFDSESGKHYNYFRTYDPTTGRYTQSDPIGLGGGWNRFAYVGGNPLGFVDPMGLQVAVGGSTGGLGGAGSSGAVGGSAGRAESLTRLIDSISTAWNGCKCMPATPENIQPLLNASPMLTLQPTISVRAVQSWVSEYEAGIPVPPIQVDGNIIVDGNHRYVASLLCGKPPGIQPWTAPLTRPRMPMRNLQIQP